MSMKNWFSIFIYFTIGASSLAVLGFGVSKLFTVTTTSAKAQTPSTTQPVNPQNLPPPENISIDDGVPAAPDEELPSNVPGEKKQKINLGILEGIIEEYDYQGEGKRDPFAPFVAHQMQAFGTPVGPVTELERFDLDQLRLIGVIWGVPKPKAMFLDPNNKTYVVHDKARIGRHNGYIAEIREGEVVIIEAFNNEGRFSYQPRILKLQRE